MNAQDAIRAIAQSFGVSYSQASADWRRAHSPLHFMWVLGYNPQRLLEDKRCG